MTDLPFDLEDDEQAVRVNDYTDYYITSHGRFYSTKQHRFVGHENNKTHYIQVLLMPPKNTIVQKRKAYIHELVLEHFGPPKPSEKHECEHIDGDAKNNNISNLQWIIHDDYVLKRKSYTKNRKPRLTKEQMNLFNMWFIENQSTLKHLSNQKIANMFKEQTDIDINLQTVRTNRDCWRLDKNNELIHV